MVGGWTVCLHSAKACERYCCARRQSIENLADTDVSSDNVSCLAQALWTEYARDPTEANIFRSDVEAQPFVTLLERLKTECSQEKEAGMLQPLLDWTGHVSLALLQPLIQELLQREQSQLQFVADKVGSSIPSDSLAARVLHLHLQHLLPMERAERSILIAGSANMQDGAGSSGRAKQLLHAVQVELQGIMKLRLVDLLDELHRKARASAGMARPTRAAQAGGRHLSRAEHASRQEPDGQVAHKAVE